MTVAAGGGRLEAVHRKEMIATRVTLDAAALLEKFIADTVTQDYDGSENAALISSVNLLGDAKAAAVFSTLVSSRMSDRARECRHRLDSCREQD